MNGENSFDFFSLIGKHIDDYELKKKLETQFGKLPKFDSNNTQLGHLSYKSSGICFTFEEENMFFKTKNKKFSERFILVAVMFFASGVQEYEEYKEQLPLKLEFSMNKYEVKEILGKPFSTGGGGKSRFLGEIPTWEKFELKTNDAIIHIQYNKDSDTIDLLTITKEKFDVEN